MSRAPRDAASMTARAGRAVRAPGWRTALLAAVLVLGGAGLAAAQQPGAVAPPGADGLRPKDAAGAPAKVEIDIIGPNIQNYSPIFLASSLGYFDQVAKAHGVGEVSIRQFSSGADTIAAFLSDGDDWTVQGVALQLTVAAEQRRDIVAVMNLQRGNGGVVMVGAKKYEASRGGNVAAYKGSAFGYTREGSNSYTWTRALAQSAGLNWDDPGQVRPLPLGTVSAYVPALRSGQVDIIGMDPGSAAEAIKLGVGYLVDAASPDSLVQRYGGDIIGLTLSTRRAFLDKHPNLSADLVGAVTKAIGYMQGHKDDPATIFNALPASYRSATTLDSYATQWPFNKDTYDLGAVRFTDSSISATVKLFKATGAIDEDLTVPSRFFDNSYNQ